MKPEEYETSRRAREIKIEGLCIEMNRVTNKDDILCYVDVQPIVDAYIAAEKQLNSSFHNGKFCIKS